METQQTVLWILIIVLFIWILYLQFNTVKESTGLASYNLSMVATDDGNIDTTNDQKELEKFNFFMRLYNKDDTIPWYTLDPSKTQDDPNMLWSLENSKYNTCYFIKSEGLGVLLTTSMIGPNSKVLRYRVSSSDGIHNSYVTIKERQGAETLVFVGLCRYNSIDGYREHLKHFNHIITSLISGRPERKQVFFEIAIFADHLDFILQNFNSRYGLIPRSTYRENKVIKSLNWLVVGSFEFGHTRNVNSPQWVYPSRSSLNYMQVQYTRTGGPLSQQVSSSNPAANFNIELLENRRLTTIGNSVFRMNNNIVGLSPTTISITLLTKEPLVIKLSNDQEMRVLVMLSNIKQQVDDFNKEYETQNYLIQDLDSRITVLEENNNSY